MIKAEDLRIGDIVKVSETGCMIPKGDVCKVVAIDSEKSFEEMNLKGCATLKELVVNHCSISCGVWCKYIAPIPLTREILTLNGWNLAKRHIDEANFEWHDYYHEDNCINIQYYPKYDSFSAFYDEDSELCEIKHVHELQHILWALGNDANLKI